MTISLIGVSFLGREPAAPHPLSTSFATTFQNTLTSHSGTLAALAPDGQSTATYNASNDTVTINAVPNGSGKAVWR